MKIAFFVDTFDPQINGVTVFLGSFVKKLKKKNHEVQIFAPKIKGYKDKSTNITRLPSIKVISSEPEAYVPAPFPSLSYKRMFCNVDLVHAHGNGIFSLLGLLAAKVRRVPFILTFHNDHTKYTHYIFGGKVIKPGAVEKMLKIFANLCDGVMTPSVKMEKALRRYGFKKPIEVIPNYVEDSLYEVRNIYFLNRELGIPKSSQILLSVGRLTKEKNYEFLIEAFCRVRGNFNDAHLVIVGKGPHRENLEKLASGLGLVDNVHFTGQVAVREMPYVYKSATMFVSSSLSEVHSMSALEAAASGLPFVVVRDDAFEGVVIDGFNGFVCALNKKEFAQRTIYLLTDLVKAKRFGLNSKKLVKKHFTPQVVVGKLISYYDRKVKEYEQEKKMVTVERSAQLPIDASLVWQRTTDILSYPSFTKFMKKAVLESDFKVGNHWFDVSTVLFFPIRFRHQIINIKQGKEVAYLINLPLGGRVIQSFEISSKNTVTVATMRVQIDLNNRLVEFFLGKFFEIRTRQMIDGTFELIQALIAREEYVGEVEVQLRKKSYIDDLISVFVYRKVFTPVIVSLVILISLTFVFAFNTPAEIKAAPGHIISKVNSKVMASKSVAKIKTDIDRVEDRFRDVVN